MSSNEVGWIVGAAALVLTIAWLVGFLKPPQKTSSKVVREVRKENETTETLDEKEDEKVDVEEDDFNLQIEPVEEPSVLEEPSDDATEVAVEETTIEVIEHIEEDEQIEPTASGRLANLREEMGTDDAVQREGTIEDRMSKFFGNDR